MSCVFQRWAENEATTYVFMLLKKHVMDSTALPPRLEGKFFEVFEADVYVTTNHENWIK